MFELIREYAASISSWTRGQHIDTRIIKHRRKRLQIHLGDQVLNGRRQPLILDEADLLTHMLVLGRTGRGKSKLGQIFVRAFIENMRGFALFDPKRRFVLDTLADISRYCIETGSQSILQRTYLIEISPGSVPYLSAMGWHGDKSVPPRWVENAKAAFYAREADTLLQIIHRVLQEDENAFPRIKRLLRAVFIALAHVGLEFGDALVLLDPTHKKSKEVWLAVRESGLLPPEIESDLHAVHSLRTLSEKLQFAEGPINRLRALLSILTRFCFTNEHFSIRIEDSLSNRYMLLVDASENRYVSKFTAQTIGSILLHRLIQSAVNEDTQVQDQRAPYPILIDEAAALFGSDCDLALRTGRSLKIPLLLFAQNLSAFRRDDADWREVVLNEPGLLFAFQSKTADELLTNVLLHGNRIDFTKATRKTQFADGFDFVALPNFSQSRSTSATRSVGGGTTKSAQESLRVSCGHSEERSVSLEVGESQESGISESVERQESQEQGVSYTSARRTGHSVEESNSETSGTQETKSHSTDKATSTTKSSDTVHGSSSSNSLSNGSSKAATSGTNFRTIDGESSVESNLGTQSVRHYDLSNTATSTSETRNSEETSSKTSEQNGESLATSQARTKGTAFRRTTGFDEAEGESTSTKIGTSRSRGKQHSATASKSRRRSNAHAINHTESREKMTGGSNSSNWSNGSGVTHGDAEGISISPLPRHRIEVEEEPHLKNSIEIQKHKLLTELSTLGVAQCLFRNDATGHTINLDVAHVADAFPNNASYYRAIDAIRNRIREIHREQYGEPDLSPQAEEKRIEEFLQRLREQRKRIRAIVNSCVLRF